jgi:hypothetical protein
MEAVDICVVNVYGHQLREEYSHVDHSATAANELLVCGWEWK